MLRRLQRDRHGTAINTTRKKSEPQTKNYEISPRHVAVRCAVRYRNRNYQRNFVFMITDIEFLKVLLQDARDYKLAKKMIDPVVIECMIEARLEEYEQAFGNKEKA